jgi:Xaa-Pro aminopeptidase
MMSGTSAATLLLGLGVVLARDPRALTPEAPRGTLSSEVECSRSGQVQATEQDVLRRAVDSLADAQLAGLSATRPRASEQDVWNAIGSTYRRLGVLGLFSVWGQFPAERAVRRMDAGELIQVTTKVHTIRLSPSDEQPFSAGISRTYPVSGTFSAEQRDVYLLVLEAEQAGARAARAGARRSDIEKDAVSVIKSGLLRLGLITDTASDEYKRWYWEGDVQRLGKGTRLTDTDEEKILRGDVDGNPDWVLETGKALEIVVGISTWEGDGVAREPETRLW